VLVGSACRAMRLRLGTRRRESVGRGWSGLRDYQHLNYHHSSILLSHGGQALSHHRNSGVFMYILWSNPVCMSHWLCSAAPASQAVSQPGPPAKSFLLPASASQDDILFTTEPDKLIDINGLSTFVVVLFLEPHAVTQSRHYHLRAQAHLPLSRLFIVSAAVASCQSDCRQVYCNSMQPLSLQFLFLYVPFAPIALAG